MPASLKDLRNRIKSIKNTQQITKAMKLVSAARFARAQGAAVQARPYSRALSALAARLVGSFKQQGLSHPLLDQPASQRVLVVAMASDRGLAAGFNSNTGKQAIRLLEQLESQGKQVTVLGVGKKVLQILLRRHAQRTGKYLEAEALSLELAVEEPERLLSGKGFFQLFAGFDKPTFAAVEQFAEVLTQLFNDDGFGEVYFVYNRFQSVMTQIPTTELVLPLKTPEGAKDEEAGEVLFEPNPAELLEAVLPRYLATGLFQAVLESNASEHGARMSAMESATRNAKELEKKYQMTYQRARQAAITKELIEIVSGAEAL